MLGANLLKGDLVHLDALDRSDMETLGPWWRNLDMSQLVMPLRLMPMTMEDEMEWFEAQRKNKNDVLFAVRRNDTGDLVGTLGLFKFDWRVRKCTFGISLGDPAVWGKGYGTDATRVALRYAFLELNMNRVELLVYSYNERAQRAYEKAGFQLEGRLRDALYREGRYHDELVMSVLRREWEGPAATPADANGE